MARSPRQTRRGGELMPRGKTAARPFHSHEIAADCIVIPRSRSWTMKSVVVLPSCTSPCAWILPV